MSGWFEILRRFLGRGVCPYELSFFLDSPFRKLILSPRSLVKRLHLEGHYRVLEIGPGTGYFSVEVARHLPSGRLEVIDIQPQMLEIVRCKVHRAGLSNVGYTVGNATQMPYPSNWFDVVFMVAVIGEVSDKKACLSEIYRVLKPGGLLSITEQPGDPDFVPFDNLCALAEEVGFKFKERYGRGRNYTANFIKPPFPPPAGGGSLG